MAKEPKKYRKNFRFTGQIAGMIEDAADRLKLTENELVANAIFDTLSNSKNFVNCPVCRNIVAWPAIIPMLEGVLEFDCKCGTHIWYDTDEDKIIKSKK